MREDREGIGNIKLCYYAFHYEHCAVRLQPANPVQHPRLIGSSA